MRLKKRKLVAPSFRFLFVSPLSSFSLVVAASCASEVVEEEEEEEEDDDEAAAGSDLQILFKDEPLLRLNLFFL